MVDLKKHEMTEEDIKRILGGEEEDKLSIVIFYAPWCGACRAFMPIIQDIINAKPKEAEVLVCNTDGPQRKFVDGLSVRSLPTTVFFKAGDFSSFIEGVYPSGHILAEAGRFFR